ncbi:MAG: hypothetical protein DF168_00078 [Candidatus Moanabacter tarae]|uniref:Aminotransferase class I/classII large domain-containing protein n=1 Tax=Candidatus Moanibacter tarae TaxID=2200854 RepID=A0A2Z4ADJ4_9BACT|nr:MAG: hypothetical protein DF168_00078 [Candidatus Moanabacter tarae]
MSLSSQDRSERSEMKFGESVRKRALSLTAEGRDANQIAKILCDTDAVGHNYGIGIVLDADGRAMTSSETILKYTLEEIEDSRRGNYQSSTAIIDDLKTAVLKWQRIPEALWGQFLLFLPSDAGTGAVKSAVDLALRLNNKVISIGVEELGWPAYSAIAQSCRIGCQKFPTDCVIESDEILPIYQAGPMNTTGRVTAASVLRERATAAAARSCPVILDRAYPGFEFSGRLEAKGYDAVMKMSYQRQIAPFVGTQTPFLIAISPTKCFRSFALRPAGMLLAYIPDEATRGEISTLAAVLMRARGCSFEHPVTRAFAKALVSDLPALEREHTQVLNRLAKTEGLWASLTRNTPIEHLFSESYSGLFRNPRCHQDSDIVLYGQHIYPVFTDGRCRINVTGLPGAEELQREHIGVFARTCFE